MTGEVTFTFTCDYCWKKSLGTMRNAPGETVRGVRPKGWAEIQGWDWCGKCDPRNGPKEDHYDQEENL